MSAQNMWDKFAMEIKIFNILGVKYAKPNHPLGRPFLTPYQIAIDFRKKYKADFEAIGLPVGGVGTGQPNSLSQYIAKEMSSRVGKRTFSNVEGGFLSKQYRLTLECTDPTDKKPIKSSARNYDLSVFRRTD